MTGTFGITGSGTELLFEIGALFLFRSRALLRRVWSNSRRPQDLAVAAVVTGAALARTGRQAFAHPPANVLREA